MRMRILVTFVGVLCLASAMQAQEPAASWPAESLSAPNYAMEPSSLAPNPTGSLPPEDGYGYGTFPEEGLPTPDLSQAPPIPPAWLAGLWNPQPLLEFRAEALFLKPNMQPSVPIANAYYLNSDRLAYVNDPVEVGVTERFNTSGRGTIEYHVNHFHSIDVSGFISVGPTLSGARVGQSDTTYFLDANAINELQRGFLTNIPTGFPTIADRLDLNWDFEQFGGEVNYWRHFIPVKGPWSDLAVGLGLRYFGFRDETNLTVVDQINDESGQMNVSSKNDMLGPQLSARAMIPTVISKRVRVFAEGKIGFMANKTSSTTFLNANGTASGATYDRTNFSPLFEGNFRVEFYIFENMTLYGGCMLLYTDRVDRAAGQYTQNLDAFVVEHKELGSLFSFGPTAGILIQY